MGCGALAGCVEPNFSRCLRFREGFLFEGIPLSEILAERAREGLFGPGAPEVLAQKRLHEIENQDVNPVQEKQYRDGRCIEVRQYPLPAGG